LEKDCQCDSTSLAAYPTTLFRPRAGPICPGVDHRGIALSFCGNHLAPVPCDQSGQYGIDISEQALPGLRLLTENQSILD
jgi:hypothetical protein